MQTPKHKVFVVGLVGGVAAGKSHVARLFEMKNAKIIDADLLGHEVLKRPLIARRLGQIFGPQILDAEGRVDRSKLAQLVFGADPSCAARLEQLEKIMHPQIHAAAVRSLRRFQESETPPAVVVIDAPLLLEAGWAPLCDVILFIDTPIELRMQRARERGWSGQQFKDREAAQLSLYQKRAAATHIIDGCAEHSALTATIDRLLDEMGRCKL